MREKQRKIARRILDEEMRPFRRAGRDKYPTDGLLRAVRQALGMPVEEVARKMQTSRSLVFDLEARELRGKILLSSMAKMSKAMGCKMVYGIVPLRGRTLEELATVQYWEREEELEEEKELVDRFTDESKDESWDGGCI
jgi:transcriptional regulator with XRE-family HTH domain